MINFLCSLFFLSALCAPTLGALSPYLVVQGGTGKATFTSAQLLYGNGTNALSSVATTTLGGTANQVSISNSPVVVGSAGAVVTLPNHVIFPGNFQVGNSTTTNATTTSLDIGGTLTFNGVTASTWSAFCTTITGGAGLCDGADATGSATWAFTPTTHWGQETQATTSALFLQGSPFSLFASSTAQLQNASTTDGFTSGNKTWLTTITSAIPLTGADGLVSEYAGTTCTNQFVRALSALGAATCATVGTADVAGLDISDDTNLTAGTGITLTNDDLSIDTSQNIATLSNLTTNGYVKTSGGVGTLGVQVVPIPVADGGTATTTWYDTGIAFYNSTLGTLSQASRATNHELVWDRTTPGLGIGSSTPWGLLSVNANGMGAGIPQLAVGSSTATNLIVASSGRVGVATTSPTSNFQFSVTGTGYFSSNATIGGALTLGTDLSVANGGTGASTFTNNRVLTGNTASAIVDEANLTFDGTLLTVTGNLTTTGVIDFGGATSFELPNGAPTVDTTGEIGVDTTSGQLKWSYNGASLGIKMPYETMAFSYGSTTQGAGTTTKYMAPAAMGLSFNTVQCDFSRHMGISLYDGTNRANYFIASSTIGTVTYTSNNTFTAGESIRVDIGTSTNVALAVTGGCRFKFLPTAD